MKYYVRAQSYLMKVDAESAKTFSGYPHYIFLEATSKKDAKEKGMKELLKTLGEGYFLITDVGIYKGDVFID